MFNNLHYGIHSASEIYEQSNTQMYPARHSVTDPFVKSHTASREYQAGPLAVCQSLKSSNGADMCLQHDRVQEQFPQHV